MSSCRKKRPAKRSATGSCRPGVARNTSWIGWGEVSHLPSHKKSRPPLGAAFLGPRVSGELCDRVAYTSPINSSRPFEVTMLKALMFGTNMTDWPCTFALTKVGSFGIGNERQDVLPTTGMVSTKVNCW